ncbi:MAG: hypothetical protein OZSIB_4253 [Candidatus Ozemobacter sibiricus]|uniref:Uncharacterized protein n=1 Tax=Candidatus Ozemobacter sibiricus TaxID=2268124 RepID=A0A367ZP14_9BACT|nr:MAG: hypothetical protein OZSIB_4253 [Candidatus Ozemobacter sibiricus]
MAGGQVPDVPMPGAPQIERPDNTGSTDAQAWEREQARQERAIERARQREERRRRRQEQKEAERRRRLEAQWYGRSPTPSRPSHRHDAADQPSRPPAWPQGLPPKRPLTSNAPSAKPRFDKTVPPGKEADKLAEARLAAAALRRKGTLTTQEQQELDDLEALARGIWKKLAANRTLPAASRMKYQVPLPVADTPGPTPPARLDQATIAAAEAQQPPRSKAFIPFTGTMTNVMVAGVEMAGSTASERGLPESWIMEAFGTPDEHFGNLLGLGKIAWTIAEKDVPGAIAETLDFLVGKITYPQAAFTAEAGRIAASVNFHAFDAFAKQAMAGVGNPDFDPKTFWKELESEMNPVQKGVFQWLGGHDDVQ